MTIKYQNKQKNVLQVFICVPPNDLPWVHMRHWGGLVSISVSPEHSMDWFCD